MKKEEEISGHVFMLFINICTNSFHKGIKQKVTKEIVIEINYKKVNYIIGLVKILLF